MARRPIVVGNWKMHKTVGEAEQLVDALLEVIDRLGHLEAGVAPPFSALPAVVARQRACSKGQLIVAAQNCHQAKSGAYTGEVSVPMLVDLGTSHVIVGHSERRQYFQEGDSLVNEKVKAVLAHALTPILCIGEQLAEREAGQTEAVVERQLRGALDQISAGDATRIVIAYEPVWAIGTGRTATPDQAQEVHAFLRQLLAQIYNAPVADAIRIQYGGSVKSSNVDGLVALPDVDGALVGGASLDSAEFIKILNFGQNG